MSAVTTTLSGKGLQPMHPELLAKLAAYRVFRNFQPRAWIQRKCELLNQYMRRCGLKACVTSVSGGIDSAVVVALCAAAMAEPNSPIQKNVGLFQPICSSAWAHQRSAANIQSCCATSMTVDQTDIFQTLYRVVEKAAGIEGADFARGQLRSYMRTPTGYYVAQLLSQSGTPAIVMGTGNQDEDGYLAYFCKAGDGTVDVQLISDLHKSEVFKVGKLLNVPEETLQAAPSADLWEGQTDEDELGFPYDFVELFTGAYLPLSDEERQAFRLGLVEDARHQFDLWAAAAEGVHRQNQHKLNGIVNL